MADQSIQCDRHTIKLTHQDKIMFPKAGLSKADLIHYYHTIAPIMLPYLQNRPLTLHRFTDGIAAPGFYQKNAADYFPSWIKRVSIAKKEGGTTPYVVCNSTATLIYLTNQLTIEYHPWLSRSDNLNKPDKMIFDLDPAGKATFELVISTALIIRKLLETLELPAFVMTTGSRGVHVVVPLKRVHSFETVRTFAHDVALHLAKLYPKEITAEMRIANRGNCIFIDSLRNAFAQTGIAPYSVRAHEYAPVATPLAWKELGTTTTASTDHTIVTVPKRVAHIKDPWADFSAQAVSLSKAIKALARL
jgi:bifunctional non-homologous end joining protein LigD